MHDRIAKNRLNIMFSQNTQWKNKNTKTKDTKEAKFVTSDNRNDALS